MVICSSRLFHDRLQLCDEFYAAYSCIFLQIMMFGRLMRICFMQHGLPKLEILSVSQ